MIALINISSSGLRIGLKHERSLSQNEKLRSRSQSSIEYGVGCGMRFGCGSGHGSDGLGFALDFFWGERLTRTRRVRGLVGVTVRSVG